MRLELSQFRYTLLDARDSQQERDALAGYELWNEVWCEALKELDGVDSIASDDYTRQERIGILFYDSEPVGSMFFSTVDLSKSMWRKDSYFKVWPESLLLDLSQRYPGKSVLVCSYFTLSKAWRKDAVGFSTKRLLISLAVETLVSSSCLVMLGTVRVNRNIHTICYEVGAQPLVTGAKHYGVDVDLIIFDRAFILNENVEGPMTKEARAIFGRSCPSVVVSLTARRDLKRAA